MFIRHRLTKGPSQPRAVQKPGYSMSGELSTSALRQRALAIAHSSNASSPIILRHPQNAANAAQVLLQHFRGLIMYAVKANPCPHLLQTLWRSGIDSFDVASIQEVRMLRRQFPTANLYFMNPVKSEYAIKEAYSLHGVRTFALDSLSELDKILAATGQDKVLARGQGQAQEKTLTLCVRVKVTSQHSKLDLGGKFGVCGTEGKELLQRTGQVARRLGLCFHVGSQSMDPEDFAQAIHQTGELAQQAGVSAHVLDVGGGFPTTYPGLVPPPLTAYLQTIHHAVDKSASLRAARLWAEPGRSLSADYNSLIVRVEKVRADTLYANDGPYGNLSDAKYLKWPLKATLLREPLSEESLHSFTFYGPTCDSGDVIDGVMLPGDVKLGDFILFETIGAYGTALSTSFCMSEGANGFVSGGLPISVEV